MGQLTASAAVQIPVLAASPIPDNVYFAALEHGTTRMDGISYNEMVQYLKHHGKGWNDNLHESFSFWFFLNFYHKNGTLAANRRLHASGGTAYMEVKEHLDKPAVLTGEAYMRYVDILELREARRASQIAESHARASIENSIEASKSAKSAFRLALISFGVSAVLSVVQIVRAENDEAETLHEIQRILAQGNETAIQQSSEVGSSLARVQQALDTLVGQKDKTVPHALATNSPKSK